MDNPVSILNNQGNPRIRVFAQRFTFVMQAFTPLSEFFLPFLSFLTILCRLDLRAA